MTFEKRLTGSGRASQIWDKGIFCFSILPINMFGIKKFVDEIFLFLKSRFNDHHGYIYQLFWIFSVKREHFRRVGNPARDIWEFPIKKVSIVNGVTRGWPTVTSYHVTSLHVKWVITRIDTHPLYMTRQAKTRHGSLKFS